MSNEEKAILVILSRLLDYPEPSFHEEKSWLLSFIKEWIQTEDIQKEVMNHINPLFELSLKDLQELYVETFDYKEKAALYLTAHELGDSRKRGIALIQLQKLIDLSGFDYTGKELVDYLPILLELLAVAPEDEPFLALSKRIAFAVNRIATHLDDWNPYKMVIELLLNYVFEAPGSEEVTRLENLREEADLEELPFPLMYR